MIAENSITYLSMLNLNMELVVNLTFSNQVVDALTAITSCDSTYKKNFGLQLM